ncbi:F-actin-capping protein subunit alpha [Entomophthora muscae]|uniref:F-actin-capping protein subunit alpha n=1 Tax=Entomophthora muscae TaxID=34485 RepID=A0ACC2SUL2_9FUNG|nr:F-actin-capping protein subunit alpha [Entomophthora muscae]
MSEEYEPLSVDERLKLAADLLLEAPPGEIDDVIADISNLVDNDELLEPKIMESLRVYNSQNFIEIELPDIEHKVLITSFNQLETDVFYDPRSKNKFKYNCISQKIEEMEAFEADEENEPLRLSIQAALDAHTAKHYPEGVCSVFATETGFAMIVIGSKLNKKNFWNGRLKSCWVYNSSSGELVGNIHSRVHYYEDGNVQLNSSREYKETLEGRDSADIASVVVSKIGRIEQEYQSALNEGYSHLNNTAFKGLRRTLPVTRSKIDWNQIMSYKLGSEIHK